jgi:Cys-rich repeat protein
MAGALVLAALMAGALAVSCSEGRFPVCKSNEECAARTGEGAGGKVCYNLKCVECAYDSDCPSGKACNGRLNVCESIGGAPASGDEGKESTEGPTTWDVNNWDECAKRCKDPDCIHVCDQRFKK